MSEAMDFYDILSGDVGRLLRALERIADALERAHPKPAEPPLGPVRAEEAKR
jgi:hypothetical protein